MNSPLLSGLFKGSFYLPAGVKRQQPKGVKLNGG
nr:MAG TPA: hypothetical protein [Caudoviricetes sp.]